MKKIKAVLADSRLRIPIYFALAFSIFMVIRYFGNANPSIGGFYYPYIPLISVLTATLLVESLRASSKLYYFGLNFDEYALRDVFLGLGIVIVSGFLAAVSYFGTGSGIIGFAPDFAGLGRLLLLFLPAVLAEEIFFRGVIFQAIEQRRGAGPAILITGILFGAAHLPNAGITALGFVNIFLAGLLLGIMYYKTRSLWLPISYHLFWNLHQVVLFGSPVSGLSGHPGSFFEWSVSAGTLADLLFGGEFGIEGGLFTTILLLLTSYFAVMRLRPARKIARKKVEREIAEMKIMMRERG